MVALDYYWNSFFQYLCVALVSEFVGIVAFVKM